MPYCQAKTCVRETAKRAEYTTEFNEVHQKHGVRCPDGHHSWPPTQTAPTGHAPFANVAWQDVPESWLLSQVGDFDPENKCARRCRAEWLRRWEAKAGHTYGGGSLPQPIAQQLPDIAPDAPEPQPILITLPPVDVADAWATVTPRDWQRAALPMALAALREGKRAVVSATIGSGKSILLAELARLLPPPDGCVTVNTAPTVRLVDQ